MGKNVVTVYFNFRNKGGAQNLALNLAGALSNEAMPVVLTDTPVEQIYPDYKKRAKFIKFGINNIVKYMKSGYVFVSHDRRSTTRLMLFKSLFRNLRLLHVSHSVFENLRFATILPPNIISISTAVTNNLRSYFKIAPYRITYIPNGLPDWGVRQPRNARTIRILMAGRICSIKRQIDIAEAFFKANPRNITLNFAGVGEDADILKRKLEGKSNVFYLGEINISERIEEFDYILLFSKKEGLPLSLIEACMSGKPMLTNDLPSVMDVNVNGVTGYVYDSLDSLIASLSTLPQPATLEYRDLCNNARKRYEELFTECKMVERYRQVLKKLQ